MSRSHNKLVQALGNGNYLTVTILRLIGFSGIVTILGAMFWVGSTSTHLADSISANTAAINRYIRTQERRDADQDNRMNRQDQRISEMLRHLMGK